MGGEVQGGKKNKIQTQSQLCMYQNMLFNREKYKTPHVGRTTLNEHKIVKI